MTSTANQTAQATLNIKKIGGIQFSTRSAVSDIEQANKVMEEMDEIVNESTVRALEIKESMNTVQISAGDTVALGSEVNQSVTKLNKLSDQLTDMVAQFKL